MNTDVMNCSALKPRLIDTGMDYCRCARCHRVWSLRDILGGMTFTYSSSEESGSGWLCVKCYDEFVKFICNTNRAEDTQYGWHDLRKDSTDLPPEDIQYGNFICVDEKGNYMTNCLLHYDEQEGCFAAESECEIMYNVVAWRMIEPFRK